MATISNGPFYMMAGRPTFISIEFDSNPLQGIACGDDGYVRPVNPSDPAIVAYSGFEFQLLFLEAGPQSVMIEIVGLDSECVDEQVYDTAVINVIVIPAIKFTGNSIVYRSSVQLGRLELDVMVDDPTVTGRPFEVVATLSRNPTPESTSGKPFVVHLEEILHAHLIKDCIKDLFYSGPYTGNDQRASSFILRRYKAVAKWFENEGAGDLSQTPFRVEESPIASLILGGQGWEEFPNTEFFLPVVAGPMLLTRRPQVESYQGLPQFLTALTYDGLCRVFAEFTNRDSGATRRVLLMSISSSLQYTLMTFLVLAQPQASEYHDYRLVLQKEGEDIAFYPAVYRPVIGEREYCICYKSSVGWLETLRVTGRNTSRITADRATSSREVYGSYSHRTGQMLTHSVGGKKRLKFVTSPMPQDVARVVGQELLVSPIHYLYHKNDWYPMLLLTKEVEYYQDDEYLVYFSLEFQPAFDSDFFSDF